MRELDILLEPWLDARGGELDEETLVRFETLLECNDMDLYAWFTGRGRPANNGLAALVDRISAGE